MLSSEQSGRWQSICDSRILFGHQSVGNNLLDGIANLMPGLPVHLCDKPGTALQPGINHFHAGENHNPASKLEHFDLRLAEYDGRCNLAAVKFCYVDIRSNTDIEALFEQYTTTHDTRVKLYPSVHFFHFTTPLRTIRSGLRSRLKSLIGQPLPVCEDNIQREAFNDMLRHRFDAENSLFDLARLESKTPEGSEYHARYRGTRIRALYPAYTLDGGHLNTNGTTALAGELLDFLAGQVKKAP